MTHASASTCGAGMSADLVTAYAQGSLTQAAAWSVEAHLPSCDWCRTVLASEVDPSRIARNRAILLTRLALEDTGRAESVAVRAGVPRHVWRLLSLMPSLRLSWLTGVVLVLATSIGAARLLVTSHGTTSAMLPYLFLAPLLPLAAVAAAFHPDFDPSADLSTAAPVSGVWLFCVRSVAVIATSVAPIMVAALALPGTGWLSLMIVLPALAICVLALALGTLLPPLSAAILVGAGWLTLVTGLGLVAGSPTTAYSGAAQPVALLVMIGAGTLLVIRRRTLDYGSKR